MSDIDPQVIQKGRLDLEEDIADELRRVGEKVTKVMWWAPFGLQMEPSLEWIQGNRVVGEDGVHMSTKSLGMFAGLLYRRLLEGEVEEAGFKRRKTSW